MVERSFTTWANKDLKESGPNNDLAFLKRDARTFPSTHSPIQAPSMHDVITVGHVSTKMDRQRATAPMKYTILERSQTNNRHVCAVHDAIVPCSAECPIQSLLKARCVPSSTAASRCLFLALLLPIVPTLAPFSQRLPFVALLLLLHCRRRRYHYYYYRCWFPVACGACD